MRLTHNAARTSCQYRRRRLSAHRPRLEQCLALLYAATWMGIAACSAGQTPVWLSDVLADDAVRAELKYSVAGTNGEHGIAGPNAVVLDVEEFVTALAAIDGNAPSWLSLPELASNTGNISAEQRVEAMEELFREFLPPELSEDGRRYAWSLYWTLSMPPTEIQRAILDNEFSGNDRSDWDIDGFRERYPEYLAELAYVWLELNADVRPTGFAWE